MNLSQTLCFSIFTSIFVGQLYVLNQMDPLLCILLLLVIVPPLILNIKKLASKTAERKWAFFHPFCNDGGGGQKVLWCMVKALAEHTSDRIVVYSLQADKEAILKKVQARFGIKIQNERFAIVHVEGKWLLNSKGFLTMILHMVLPMIYAYKCLWKYQPDIFYDTTGYASTLVLVKLMLPSCKTAAYVHYPFISEDMIQKVRDQRQDFNNSGLISKSPILSKAKLIYYQVVLQVYRLIGRFVDFAQTNSSWTHGHMSLLWPTLLKTGRLVKLYPPCTVNSLLTITKPDPSHKIHMMSLAQFRPQKQQLLQLEVFSQLMKSGLNKSLRFRICGTTRGPQDEAILQNLRLKAHELDIQSKVQFVVNQPFSKIEQCLKECWIGFHTMESEHFGISLVEMLAAGLIVIAHNSAGPKQDIIKDARFLADEKEDYAAKIRAIVQSSTEQLLKLSKEGRKKAQSFGQEQFRLKFLQSLPPLKKAL